MQGGVPLECRREHLPIATIAPAEMKRVIAGSGRATKVQVQRAVLPGAGCSRRSPTMPPTRWDGSLQLRKLTLICGVHRKAQHHFRSGGGKTMELGRNTAGACSSDALRASEYPQFVSERGQADHRSRHPPSIWFALPFNQSASGTKSCPEDFPVRSSTIKS